MGLLHELALHGWPACKTPPCMRRMTHVNYLEGETLLCTVLRCLPHPHQGAASSHSFLPTGHGGMGSASSKLRPNPVTLHLLPSEPGHPIFTGQVNADQCSAVLLLEEEGSEREDLHLACRSPHENTGSSCERMCCVYAEVFLLLARAALLSVCLNHKLNLIFLRKQGQ